MWGWCKRSFFEIDISIKTLEDWLVESIKEVLIFVVWFLVLVLQVRDKTIFKFSYWKELQEEINVPLLMKMSPVLLNKVCNLLYMSEATFSLWFWILDLCLVCIGRLNIYKILTINFITWISLLKFYCLNFIAWILCNLLRIRHTA